MRYRPQTHLRGAVAALLTLLPLTGLRAADAPALVPATGFTHGPMLGALTSHSVRVWARTRAPGEFAVVYGTSPDLTGAVTSRPVRTSWEHDATGVAELTGLQPNTKYYYALTLGGSPVDTRVNGQLNSFRTLPDAETYRHPVLNPDGRFNFSFEAGSCNRQTPGKGGEAGTFTTMLSQLKDRIYFSIQNGDWIYEQKRETTIEQWAAANHVDRVPEYLPLARGLTGVWENYKAYLEDSQPLADFFREVPQFVTLDDHEILNDVIGSGEIGFRTDARGKPWQQGLNRDWTRNKDVERAVFRDPALAAWDDYVGWTNPDIGRHQPIAFGAARVETGGDLLTDPRADFSRLDLNRVANLHVLWGYGNTGVYQVVKVVSPTQLQVRPRFTVTEQAHYSLGTNHYSRFRIGNADFYLLDARSNRTLHDKRKPLDQHTSMLGAEEERWLLDSLRRTDAELVFIVSSVNFSVPHDNGAWLGNGLASADKDDGWTAQIPARERLLKVLEGLHKPVVIITGDLHKSYLARLAPGIIDVAAGPHSSNNHRLVDAGGSPPSGWYDAGGGRLVNLLWTSTQYRNDSPRRGAAPAWPVYTVIRVNNAYNVPDEAGRERWIAYPEPQVLVEFRDGNTGELLFAHAVTTAEAKAAPVPVPLARVRELAGVAGNR